MLAQKNKVMRNVLLLVGLALLFISCENRELEQYYETAILGEWQAFERDDVLVNTDDVFVSSFSSDNSQKYCVGYQLANGKEWKESGEYTYKIKGDILIIEGFNAEGKSTYLKADIDEITDTYLEYEVEKLKIDGVEIIPERDADWRFEKVEPDMNIVGMWLGLEEGANNAAKWDFKADGTYDYYFMNALNEFELKEDNNGVYFIYGDLLVCNYTNDMNNGTTGRTYECFKLSMGHDGVLFWRAINDGVVRNFSLMSVGEYFK